MKYLYPASSRARAQRMFEASSKRASSSTTAVTSFCGCCYQCTHNSRILTGAIEGLLDRKHIRIFAC